MLLSATAKAQTAPDCDFSGIWYDPHRSGDGYNVYETPFGWVIYFLGYDDWGSPFWITSELGRPEVLQFGSAFRLLMWIGPNATGGEFNEPLPPDELEIWGTLDVAFHSCTTGTFELAADDTWTFGHKTSSVVKLAGPK